MTIQFELIDDGTTSIYEGPVLYKKDSTGRLRTWRMQLDENGRYRTLAGLADGKQAESEWTVPVPKSKPTVKEQGEFEVRAQYKHQLDREYHATADTVDTPKMIEPMLAKTYSTWPGPGYAQPKLDGIRCIMTAVGMFSRQGQPITAVPHLHAAAAPLFAEHPDVVLDGELYNHDLREDFGAISSIVRKKNPTADDLAKAEKVMQYHVYDIVDPTQTFNERNRQLAEMLNDLNCPWFVTVETMKCDTEEQANESYGWCLERGFEGGIYRLDQPYEIGRRSKFLLKRKEFITEEYPVINVEPGQGNWAGAAKRFTLQLPDGRTFGAGVRGSYEKNKALLEAYDPAAAVQPAATLRYFQLTPDGVPRFPVVVDFHPAGRVD